VTAAPGPSRALDAVPCLRRSDFPRCPSCNLADDVMRAGRWADGLGWWHCCHCEHDWTTVTAAQGPSPRQVADLVCSLCGWHSVVWRTQGAYTLPSANFHGPADALFAHVETCAGRTETANARSDGGA
jgi:hypothetical protein